MERTSSSIILIYELAQAKRNYFYTKKELKTLRAKCKRSHPSLIILDLPRAAGYLSGICSLQERCYLLKATLSKHSALGNTQKSFEALQGNFTQLPSSAHSFICSYHPHSTTDNKYSNIDLKGLFRFALPYTAGMLNGTARRIHLRKTSICTLSQVVGKKSWK